MIPVTGFGLGAPMGPHNAILVMQAEERLDMNRIMKRSGNCYEAGLTRAVGFSESQVGSKARSAAIA